MSIIKAIGIFAVAFLPFQISTASEPSSSTVQLPQSHLQTIPIAYEAVFPKIIETLVDNDCIILAANEALGVITFRAQSEDNGSNRRHDTIEEGTLLIKRATQTSTLIRAKLIVSWQDSFDDATFRAGVQKDAAPEMYKSLFDSLEKAFKSSGK